MGKALRRALETADVVRINSNQPLITDTTELITPKEAEAMLQHNKQNRPINWHKVEEYAEIMRRGDWKLHPQGIILDPNGNILTGQTRLWAVVYAGCGVYLRVSRGCPQDRANVIDRGRPQSARDLSSRKTDRKHSPVEVSITRCVAILNGNLKPSTDDIAAVLVEKDAILRRILKETAGAKKDKAFLMILGAATARVNTEHELVSLLPSLRGLADRLDKELTPYSAETCWGRGIAFSMALKKAQDLLR